MITMKDYLMGRDAAYPLSPIQADNAKDTINKLAQLEIAWGQPLTITSGYRPAAINFTVPGAKSGDAHEKCCGADLRDPGGSLSDWLMNNRQILVDVGLWMEAPSSAKNHVHVQTYPPRSGNRIFVA